jgi:hypothetical protein
MGSKKKKAVKLTGKAKEDFEKWCVENHHGFMFKTNITKGRVIMPEEHFRINNSTQTKCVFEDLPIEFQNTMLVMWLDSIDKILEAVNVNGYTWKAKIKETGPNPTICFGFFNTREEAIGKGIERLIESHNMKFILGQNKVKKYWWN